MTVRNLVLGLFLLISAVIDIRTRQVKWVLLMIFAAAGIVLYMAAQPVGIADEFAGILTGAVFIAIWHLTGGKIGLGDALLMIVTGIYLGGRGNAALIMGAMFLAAMYSAFILMIKKADKEQEIAFVPFMFISYLGMVFI